MAPIGGRGSDGADADIVLLAVPDAQIRDAASAIAPGPLVGHLSGITLLADVQPRVAFALHPLLTVTGPGASFAGVFAAIAGANETALNTARALAELLDMRPFEVADEDRTAYHAAASIASNFLVTLEGVAEQLAASAGVPRAALVPLAAAALRNFEALGARDALTGPISRGDEATVARQREAVAERLPDQLGLFDALVTHTRKLSGGTS
ncbi:DUF2520 domain-containing protein [Leucobacter insecticola]|uniref:DUF2520 domain-containing protein n=2 Tax=Leucobacter insecticola TaxID=2714934 RepID=A0A6G8FLT5_9MICO|nr:DUF2520 domain-containing protein [Leucobacter insecticola]